MNAPSRFLGKILRKLRGAPAHPWIEITGQVLARGRRVALITNWPDEKPAWLDKAVAQGAQVDLLPVSRPWKREDGRVMAFLDAPPRQAYDAVVADSGIELFDYSWSYAFLDRLNLLLDDKGVLLVSKRALPLGRLEQLFGRGPIHTGKRYFTFEKAKGGLARPPDAAVSTLDAYWALADDLSHDRFEPRLLEVVRGLGGEPSSRPPEIAGERLKLLQTQCYRTSSVRVKAALVQRLAEIYFPGRRDLHLLDLGAGTGLNSLEVMLNENGVSALTLLEINPPYHWAIAAVCDWLGKRLRGEVSLFTGRIERYKGRPADMTLIFGVFPVAGRAQHAPLMEGAWQALAPGGILIVLENMRDPVRFAGYGDNCFTPEEIDALMGGYAPVRYFDNRLQELEHSQVGSATLFRVIRKPFA